MSKETAVGCALSVLLPPRPGARDSVRKSNYQFRSQGFLAVLLLVVLPLSGCFKSDKPLISAFDTVAPIPEGHYISVNADKTTNSVVITHDWNTTKLITLKADGSVKITNLRMAKVDKGYYIVMDPDNDYTLIRVNPKNVIEFDGSKLGDKLLDVARTEGKDISDYGVARVTGDSSHTCWFNDIDDMKRAMAALANSGTKMPDGTFYVNGLVIANIYERQ